jgi:16S rRNA A1518/A1519 N6-dimethyltransferase RsmA/KsgA/DIM1 with predicted DNA glycosylase/AP lyase activity
MTRYVPATRRHSWETALKQGGLAAGSRILEVGCGTGKLTELLVGRGCLIDAVEPGPRMIEAAKKRLGTAAEVRFHLGTFEDDVRRMVKRRGGPSIPRWRPCS